MSFFGNNNCGYDENYNGGGKGFGGGCGCGCDPCTLLIIMLLCGSGGNCGGKGCGCDICSIIWILLILNCCGCGSHGGHSHGGYGPDCQ